MKLDLYLTVKAKSITSVDSDYFSSESVLCEVQIFHKITKEEQSGWSWLFVLSMKQRKFRE